MQVWLDARGSGLDRDKWKADCLAEVATRPPRTQLEAHLLIKGFLAKGPSDPYTRFIAPDEFKQLTKFDVSGVGVNIVSGEEYVAKMSRPLPRGKQAADGGAWVVGLIKVRPATRRNGGPRTACMHAIAQVSAHRVPRSCSCVRVCRGWPRTRQA